MTKDDYTKVDEFVKGVYTEKPRFPGIAPIVISNKESLIISFGGNRVGLYLGKKERRIFKLR